MIAEFDTELLDWLTGILNGRAGGFLSTIAEAAFRADRENYAILRPALLGYKAKYPDYTALGMAHRAAHEG